jgi:hypothetical protein
LVTSPGWYLWLDVAMYFYPSELPSISTFLIHAARSDVAATVWIIRIVGMAQKSDFSEIQKRFLMIYYRKIPNDAETFLG